MNERFNNETMERKATTLCKNYKYLLCACSGFALDARLSQILD